MSEIEKTTTDIVYQPGEDWQSLTARADELLGYDLARDETADDLVGVPFVLTRVVFRPGVLRDKERQAYVSCEVRVAPELDLRLINSRRSSSKLPSVTSLDSLAFGPDSHVVFNDGSTGVYRQVVKLLVAKQYVTLAPPIIEAGGYGDCSFDQPPGRWTGYNRGQATGDGDEFIGYSADVALFCPRGLRLSLYENDYTQTGKTRYFA